MMEQTFSLPHRAIDIKMANWGVIIALEKFNSSILRSNLNCAIWTNTKHMIIGLIHWLVLQ